MGSWRDDVDLTPARVLMRARGVERYLQSFLDGVVVPFAPVEIPYRRPVVVVDYLDEDPNLARSGSSGLRSVPGLKDAPSPGLFALLAGLDVADVDDSGLLDACSASHALMGALTARMLLATAELYTRRTFTVEGRVEAARATGDPTQVRRASRAADITARAVEDELALQLSCSRTLAARQICLALTLTTKLPCTFEALAAGTLELRKAGVISDLVGDVTDPVIRGLVEAAVLPHTRGWNLPRLREEITKEILRLDPATAAERHERARQKRRVVFTPVEDDMTELWALLPADEAARMRAALDIAADHATTPDDHRCADQRRTDAMVDAVVNAIEHPAGCCTEEPMPHEPGSDEPGSDEPGSDEPGSDEPDAGGAAHPSAGPASADHAESGTGDAFTRPAKPTKPTEREAARKRERCRARRAIRHEVQVVVPLETLTGDADEPGYLTRYGPISAALARRMAADVAATGSWRCVITDDEHGTVLGLGRSTLTPTYQPSPQLRRHLDIRDRHCTFPGCRAPAAACDKDHRTPYPHGPTCEDNLGSLCGHHHRVKRETSMRVRVSRDPAHPPGTVIWTTPTGREYLNTPTVVGIPEVKARSSKARSSKAGSNKGRSSKLDPTGQFDSAAPLDLGPPPF